MSDQSTLARMSEAKVQHRLDHVRGVLGAADHTITDPYLNHLLERRVRGEISGDDARELGLHYLEQRDS